MVLLMLACTACASLSQSSNGGNASRQPSPTTAECCKPIDLQITDPTTLLFLQAATNYKSMDTATRAIISSYWDNALSLGDITQLAGGSMRNHPFEFKENESDTFKANHVQGFISIHQVHSQVGHIVTFTDSSGNGHDLSLPAYYGTGKNTSLTTNVDYTKRDEHILLGTFGGYGKAVVQGSVRTLFIGVVPQLAEKLSSSEYKTLKAGLEVEAEGNPTTGYYRVRYDFVVFTVDGHEVLIYASTDAGFGSGLTDGTAKGFLFGVGSGASIFAMNSKIGQVGAFVFGNADPNQQFANYIEKGGARPPFMGDAKAVVGIDGQTAYTLTFHGTITMEQLPYLDAAVME